MADFKEKAVIELNKALDVLDQQLKDNKTIQSVAEKAKARPAHIALALAGLLILVIGFGVGTGALAMAFGFAYPVYASFKALQTEAKEDDTQLLIYWVVYGFFVLFESFTTILTQYIPFWFIWKMCFLAWCFLPQTRGAEKVYQKVVLPILNKYEGSIDSKIGLARSTATAVVDDVKGDVQDAANEAVLQAAIAGVSGKKLM